MIAALIIAIFLIVIGIAVLCVIDVIPLPDLSNPVVQIVIIVANGLSVMLVTLYFAGVIGPSPLSN